VVIFSWKLLYFIGFWTLGVFISIGTVNRISGVLCILCITANYPYNVYLIKVKCFMWLDFAKHMEDLKFDFRQKFSKHSAEYRIPEKRPNIPIYRIVANNSCN